MTIIPVVETTIYIALRMILKTILTFSRILLITGYDPKMINSTAINFDGNNKKAIAEHTRYVPNPHAFPSSVTTTKTKTVAIRTALKSKTSKREPKNNITVDSAAIIAEKVSCLVFFNSSSNYLHIQSKQISKEQISHISQPAFPGLDVVCAY